MDDEKHIIHAISSDIYMNEKQLLIKVEYFTELSGSGEKKVIWVVLENHVVENPNENDEIGPWVFFFFK